MSDIFIFIIAFEWIALGIYIFASTRKHNKVFEALADELKKALEEELT